jgi:hypothetical protein
MQALQPALRRSILFSSCVLSVSGGLVPLTQIERDRADFPSQMLQFFFSQGRDTRTQGLGLFF